MQVVCLQEEAFYALFDKVVEHVESKLKDVPAKWMDGEEAMLQLKIKSTTTLQKLRDEGKIRFSQPQKKIILYDRDSIIEYIEQHVRETFKMKESIKVDEKFKRACNLGYELAKELNLKTPMFQNESSDITLKNPKQEGMFQFVQDRQAVLNKKVNNSNDVLKRKTIKNTFGKNGIKGKGLTP